ncbi:hypothetical protein GGF37_003551, partial [Kickxella alabastrina]
MSSATEAAAPEAQLASLSISDPISTEPQAVDNNNDSDSEAETNTVEGGDASGAQKKKKKNRGKKKKSKGPGASAQTSPPSIPVSQLFLNNSYPVGELQEY